MVDTVFTPGAQQRDATRSELHVAGKTGTAQVVGIAQDATYDEESLSEYQRNHGWFIALHPLRLPK